MVCSGQGQMKATCACSGKPKVFLEEAGTQARRPRPERTQTVGLGEGCWEP